LGYDPTTPASWRVRYYVLHAYDRYGVKLHVVADVQLGDFVSIRPVFVRPGPRIIHGQTDEACKR
jgi:hypothetical protein